MRPRRPASAVRAFTLLELVISMGLLAGLVAVLAQGVSAVQKMWRDNAEEVELARTAAIALDRIAADLAAVPRISMSASSDDSDEEPREYEWGDAPWRFTFLLSRGGENSFLPRSPGEAEDGGMSYCSYMHFLKAHERPLWTAEDRVPRTRPRDGDVPARSLSETMYNVYWDKDEGPAHLRDPWHLRQSLWRGEVALLPGENPRYPDDDQGTSERLARNVVWFNITIPDFLGVATNQTDSAPRVWRHYASDESGIEDFVEESKGLFGLGPVPPLVDIELGLVSDRTMRRALSLPKEQRERLADILRRGMHVYVRRVEIP